MAAKKKAKGKKKAARKTAKKKVAKKSIKKKVARKATKKTVRKAAKKPAKKAAKKKAVKKVAKKPAAKIAKPSAPKAPKGTPVTFVLDAPTGWDVALAGSFNNWEPRAMVKEADGLWRITVHLERGTYQYRFLVDTEWREDPANLQRVPNDFGGYNSVIDVP